MPDPAGFDYFRLYDGDVVLRQKDHGATQQIFLEHKGVWKDVDVNIHTDAYEITPEEAETVVSGSDGDFGEFGPEAGREEAQDVPTA